MPSSEPEKCSEHLHYSRSKQSTRDEKAKDKLQSNLSCECHSIAMPNAQRKIKLNIIIMHLYFTNIYVWYTIHICSMFILQYVNSTANHSGHGLYVYVCVSLTVTRLSRSEE